MTDFKRIEQKWQKRWDKEKIFKVKESRKKKFYCLEMYPYPSGSGLHMGHAFNYTIGDAYARFKRMSGYNVLYPMGYDSFGLPAENAAIRAKIHPRKFTERAIKNFIKQQKALGLSYDWTRLIKSSDPEYYKWNQLFFLKFLENNLAYRKKSSVNWCPKCNTVLANEQVHNGKCWRHKDTEVQLKQLEQWFLKTTNYSEELLKGVDKLEWPENIKIMQRNWIGRSYGTDINFTINNETWPVFTTRPDTIYGATFMVISTQHPRLMELVTDKQKKATEKFLKKIKSTKQEDIAILEKEGVFTGTYAINPVNNEKIPVYAGNFVIAEYGSGLVMAVPAHDQRDFEFAQKYSIQIRVVVQPKDQKLNSGTMKKAYVDLGVLVKSGKFSGLINEVAKQKITDYLKSNKQGRNSIQYKLRDWLVSRQRYWGTPIPIIYCDKCGIVPVPEKDLPVLLPERVVFGKGNPLATSKKFVNVKCPKCKNKARRETDTMDTFFDSSWYFLRYTDNTNIKAPFNKKKINYWMSVDQYIGGAEHACMHLIYARFFTKALRDLGYLKIDEPFTRLFNQGMLHGEDGYVMAKSRGNIVIPEQVSIKYGIDTARIFLMSLASLDKDLQWSDKGIEGSARFINKLINYFDKYKGNIKADAKLNHKMNKTIKLVTEYIDTFKYNLAIIEIRKFFDAVPKNADKKVVGVFLKLLSPFCPHITEELWHKIGNKTFISLEKWPKYYKSKIKAEFEKHEELQEKLISDINNIFNLIKQKQKESPKKIFIYSLPKEKDIYKDVKNKIESIGLETNIYSVSDKNKYDPRNKAKKAKPGKPAIYVE